MGVGEVRLPDFFKEVIQMEPGLSGGGQDSELCLFEQVERFGRRVPSAIIQMLRRRRSF